MGEKYAENLMKNSLYSGRKTKLQTAKTKPLDAYVEMNEKNIRKSLDG